MTRILGFGACMIKGSPFATGFLQMAVQDQSELVIKSFGGFPAHRASKYFPKALRSGSYDVVVLQFGAIDANVILRLLSKVRDNTSEGSPTSPSSPFRMKSLLRWIALDLVSLVSRKQVFEINVYLRSMEIMISQAEEIGLQVIIVSPFLSGPRFRHKRASLYRDELAKVVKGHPQAVFVDALSKLEAVSKRLVLMHNGFHLSEFGHSVVAASLRSELDRLSARN